MKIKCHCSVLTINEDLSIVQIIRDNTDQHPGGDGSHALHVGGVGGDHVEDVGEHEEEGDEHRHPAGDNIRGDEETDPGDHNEEAGGEIVDDEVLQEVALQLHLNS